ncbi:unnamed protein product [Cochlearia groenlandica]
MTDIVQGCCTEKMYRSKSDRYKVKVEVGKALSEHVFTKTKTLVTVAKKKDLETSSRCKRAVGELGVRMSNLALEPKSRFRYHSLRRSSILVARYFVYRASSLLGVFQHPVTKLSGILDTFSR